MSPFAADSEDKTRILNNSDDSDRNSLLLGDDDGGNYEDTDENDGFLYSRRMSLSTRSTQDVIELKATNIMHLCAFLISAGSAWLLIFSDLNSNNFDSIVHEKYPVSQKMKGLLCFDLIIFMFVAVRLCGLLIELDLSNLFVI